MNRLVYRKEADRVICEVENESFMLSRRMSHFEGLKSISVPVSDNNWHSVYYSGQSH